MAVNFPQFFPLAVNLRFVCFCTPLEAHDATLHGKADHGLQRVDGVVSSIVKERVGDLEAVQNFLEATLVIVACIVLIQLARVDDLADVEGEVGIVADNLEEFDIGE